MNIRILFFGTLIFAVTLASSSADIIVSLDTGGAFYDKSLNGTGIFTVPTVNNSNGVTFNIDFTPAAADVATGAINAVNLLEIGGNANGTGLYLLNGEIHFLGKMTGLAGDVVSSFNDLAYDSGNNMVGVKAGFGALNAGTAYSVAIVYDPIGSDSLQLALLEDGQAIQTENYSFTGRGAKTTWPGNRTITAFVPPINGGGATTNAAHPFQESNILAFAGTQGDAYMWNNTATFVPEPGVATLLLLGAGGLLTARRRR